MSETIPTHIELLGHALSLARTEKGMTQKELAFIVGISQASIRNIEHGRQAAPLLLLAQIASVLEVPVTDIIVHFNSYPLTEEQRKRSNQVQQLKDEISRLRSLGEQEVGDGD